MERDNQAVTAFKVWIFPGIVSIMTGMIWQEVKEVKSDVKALLAQSNVDKTRIDNLERMMYPIQAPTSSRSNGQDPRPAPIKLITAEFLPAKNELEDDEKNPV